MSWVDAYEYLCKTQTNRLSWASERAGGLRAPDAGISSRMSAPTRQASSYFRGWVTTTSSRKPASQERRRCAGQGRSEHRRRTLLADGGQRALTAVRRGWPAAPAALGHGRAGVQRWCRTVLPAVRGGLVCDHRDDRLGDQGRPTGLRPAVATAQGCTGISWPRRSRNRGSA
jgi:hypothetical protein